MATPSSPFAFAQTFFSRIGERLQPPPWAVHEIQQRAVLFLNHVLQQEPEAQQRLARQSGRVVEFRWRFVVVKFVVTPAGLLDLAPEHLLPELTLWVTEESPFGLAGTVLRGAKPAVRIEGDVQLAAEVNWLVDHVRWDVEEDLSRVVGDAPAHAIGTVARRGAEALRSFVKMRPDVSPDARPGAADTSSSSPG